MNFRAASTGARWRRWRWRGVAFIGLICPPLRVLYDYAWFVGFGVSFVVYLALMAGNKAAKKAPG